MKLKKFNLNRRLHVYESFEEMEKQFSKDVETRSKDFERVLSRCFNLRSAWDQAVLVAIMTNLLAYVTIHAKDNGVDLEYAIMDTFDEMLDHYTQLVKKGQMKG